MLRCQAMTTGRELKYIEIPLPQVYSKNYKKQNTISFRKIIIHSNHSLDKAETQKSVPKAQEI